jgi:methyl-accepting chemotaxis protein
MANNKFFPLTRQVNRLSSKLPSSSGPVSFASDINITVKKQDYANAINKFNSNILSRMLTNSRNYKKNISNSTLGIRDTNIVVQDTVATVQETVATVQETVATVQETVSITGVVDPLTGQFNVVGDISNLAEWPVKYIPII